MYRKLAGIRKLTPVVDGPRYQSALTVNNESTAGDGGLALHYAAMFVGKQGHRVDLLHMWEHDLDVVVALHREPNNNWRYVVNGYVSPLKFKKRWQAVDAAALHEGLPARGDQKRLYHHRNNIQPGPWLYNDGAAAAMHPVAK